MAVIIMSKKVLLPSTFSVKEEINGKDNRFLEVAIDVMHTGKNYNGSYFEKTVVDKCVESIKNTPILGFVKYNDDTKELDFKGHEYVITRSENGVEEKYIGEAIGVIPESCNPRWIIKTDNNNVEREYLQVDGLIWTKFEDSANIFERDIIKSESMELYADSIDGYEDENGIFHFTDFKFDGCCALGEGVLPAMSGASIELNFTLNEFVSNVQEQISKQFALFSDIKNTKQGGINTMAEDIISDVENIEEINVEDIDEPVIDEVVEEPVENTTDNNSDINVVSDTNDFSKDFSQTSLEIIKEIQNILSEYTRFDEMFGCELPCYYFVDIQDSEVIVADYDTCEFFGLPLSINGDKVEIDFENKCKKKIHYDDYIDNDNNENVSEINNFAKEIKSVFQNKITSLNDKISEYETNYTMVKSELDEIKPKYDKYVEIEQEQILAEEKAKKVSEFTKYESILADVEAFTTLKTKIDEMSLSEIESECAILYARKMLPKNSFSTSELSSGIIEPETLNDTNTFYSEKYGTISIRK